jgi:hypothetical protein
MQNLVTAGQDSRGNLKVIIWEVDADGNVTRSGDASAGQISLVSATGMATRRFATAVQDGDSNLKVIVWDVDSDGNVIRRGAGSAGAIGLVSATAVKPRSAADIMTDRLVTAVQDSVGNLKVIVWDVDSDGNVTRRGAGSAGAIGLVSTVTVKSRFSNHDLSSGLVTAVQDSVGNLKVIVWDVDSDGNVTRKGAESASAIGLVSTANLVLRSKFVTAVQDSRSNLKIIMWEVDRAGNVTRSGDISAGQISLISASLVVINFATAVRDGDGNLKVIAWGEVGVGGHELIRKGAESAGAIDLVSAASIEP